MIQRQQHICILGNSVSLLIQPFRINQDEMTYGEHLERSSFKVTNSSKQSAIISDVYRYLEDECIRHFPDFVVFNFGIVECTTRTRPRWLQNVFSMNAWNNSIINKGYNNPYYRGFKFIFKKIFKLLIEKPLFTLGISWTWLSVKDFKFILRDLVKKIFQDSPVKKIILIGMLPVTDWVEKKAPGTKKNQQQFNQVMRDVCSEFSNVIYFDSLTLINESLKFEDITLDGIHFTANGHRLLADSLIPLLSGDRQNFTDWEKVNQYERLYSIYENWFKRKTPSK